MVSPTSLALRAPLFRFILRAVAFALVPAAVAAQATQTVAPNDPVYAFIDRLVAARLVDTVIVGQRSMSRAEIARIISEAKRRSGDASWLAQRLREYSAVFPDSISRSPITTLLETDATALESPGRGIESDGTGSIDVALNPLTSSQFGRRFADGLTLSYRGEIGGGITPWLAGAVAGRSDRFKPRGGESDLEATTERLYLRSVWKNIALLAGRDHLFLGQGVNAGLMLSANSRAVDQIRLSSDKPFVLPGWLRYIGPAHATIALGDLGPNQTFPHTRLLAYKLSSRPHRRFEIGAGLTEQVGGQGAPGGTFLQKATDAFPLIDAAFLHRNFLFSNKFVGVDIRYTLPGIQGTQFYAEGVFDDFDIRRVRSVFTEDAGYVWGLSASCFAECGPVRASAEYHVTGVRYYTHAWYKNGYTVDQTFLGDPLGPRGRGGYAMIDIDGGRRSLNATLAYEDRSGNKYGATSTTPNDADFRFVILEARPAERRWRAVTTTSFGSLSQYSTWSLMVGAERVENFAHVQGAWRTNWLARLGAQIRPTLPFF